MTPRSVQRRRLVQPIHSLVFLNIAAMSNWERRCERDGIGIGQLDLAMFASRTQDSDVGKHTSTRANDHHGFLGRVESVLVQVLADRQFLAWTKQLFYVLIGEMDMAREMLTTSRGVLEVA